MTDYLYHLLSDSARPPTTGVLPGLGWQEISEGILEFTPTIASSSQGLVISAGIHGNETAPVEILNRIVTSLIGGELPLRHPLLVIFGHPPALRAGTRFIDYDMNRLFSGAGTQIADCYEVRRAAELEAISRAFRQRLLPQADCWHLDLHTAIRGSVFPKFGLLPASPRSRHQPFLGWLESTGVEALVFHRRPGGTFSHFSANSLQMESCTLELGKALPFGSNHLADFTQAERAIRTLISGEVTERVLAPESVRYFQVAQQITRYSDDFVLHMSDQTLNFTEFAAGSLLAEDGGQQTRVGSQRAERVLFPNPRVANGLRAGLMLVEES